MYNKKNFVIVLIIIIMGIFILNFYNREYFDKDGISITRYGDVKYDLKGERSNVRNITNCYYDKRICYDNTFGNTERNTYGGQPLGRHN